MKKIIILSSVLCVLAGTSANAQVSVEFDNPDVSVTLGEPVYVAPPVYAPGYVEYYHRYPSQYYDRHGHHRHDDWSYWANERKGRNEHDQRGHEHHDNGNHGEGNRGNGNRDHGDRDHK